MTLIASKKKPEYKWHPGDLIGAPEASALLGYKSPKQFQDQNRLRHLVREFEAVGCTLTTDIWIGGRRRFRRSEIDTFLSCLTKTAVQ